jgi:hypothetical protein
MTRDEWLKEFAAELLVLRPHLGPHHAFSAALITYGAMGIETEPKQAASEYHMRRERGERLALRRKRQPK